MGSGQALHRKRFRNRVESTPSPTHPAPLTCSSHARLIEPDGFIRMDETKLLHVGRQ